MSASSPRWSFRFWQLVRQPDGSYRAAPCVTIYDGMVEVYRPAGSPEPGRATPT